MVGRIHALDGLRGIASVLVLIHHLGAANLASALEANGRTTVGKLLGGVTASGVELFFVLSAIVLAGPYVRGDRAFELGTYFWRRLKRL